MWPVTTHADLADKYRLATKAPNLHLKPSERPKTLDLVSAKNPAARNQEPTTNFVYFLKREFTRDQQQHGLYDGQQGGAVIKTLLSTPSPTPIQIFALTRNPTSPRSQSLAKDLRITLISGDATDSEAIFAQTGPIDSVFLVTIHGPAGFEEQQAESLITASLAHGVTHFVFSSADRGGDILSEDNETDVPHIASKHRIEKMLKRKTDGTSMKWTILRPVSFMDNLTDDFKGKGFAAMWRLVGKRRIQLVWASDVGTFAAMALLDPKRFEGRAVGVAGDELNFEEAAEVFKREMGREFPASPCVVGKVIRWSLGDIGAMFKWFETGGFKVDIQKARAEFTGLKDFRGWLREESEFVTGG
ncbi:hypothetical protein B7494_g7245 [Chlorociboria aeruginascens]|nr:hypothetical protein B7494_g7245 [Chlorociboria aeruginascens]